MNKKIILFDIDYTLFNTDKFRDVTYPKLMKLLQQEDTSKFHLQAKEAELSLRKEGGFGPVNFAKLLADMLQIEPDEEKLEELFYNENLYRECLYPEVEEALLSLSRQENILTGIISTGEGSFQERKIASIRHFFQENMIHIYTNKLDHVTEILALYRDQNLLVVDDALAFLDALKDTNERVATIFVKRDKKHEENVFSYAHQPNITVTNLTEVVSLLDNETI